MTKQKIREISLTQEEGTFSFLKKLTPSKEEYDFEGISALRALLSNERARILHFIKVEKPVSIYSLAKKLGRTFKSVSDDIKLLERFGLIEIAQEKTKNRVRHKPILSADLITINIKI
ncbi:helix-turn-helix domain-containing protein [Candidatus Pacearchaeota archaeon]|nr:helix-turn-helix domain-containing protein [Candidatus Pacearchaeota archaeon]